LLDAALQIVRDEVKFSRPFGFGCADGALCVIRMIGT
jgi:hypothetical protein